MMRNSSNLVQGMQPMMIAVIISTAISAMAISAMVQTQTAPLPPLDEKRAPWTNSRIRGSPEPPLPYITEPAFPFLKFNNCLDITSAPGSDRLFVAEQGGKIFSFPAKSNVEKADLVVDLAKDIPGVKQVYAMTFHPRFEQNRFCYVCYIQAPDLKDGSHIARFRVSDTDPPTIDVGSETTIFTWWSGGHNGCCLKFGPDGCLYISTGDGTGPNPPDTLRAGQDVSNVLSAILRIDVDHPADGKNYRIPSDNPLIDIAGARGEIWAYGFRNPWRMSFDRKSGDLWVGDVGWELWEMLDRVERGGNYGWSVIEGRQPTNPEWPRGPTPILPPTIEHPHSESSSITDGLTYYGDRVKELQGMHIYGDYDTGKIWGFRFREGQVVDHRELADTTHRIVGFGEDSAGECYLLDHTAGTIHRLVSNPQRNQESSFPRTLSATGIFSDLSQPTPSPGVIPYSIHAELWSDFSTADRWVAVPNDLAIKVQDKAWTYPQDSVLVKTLSLEMERGNPATRRSLETQILHFDGVEWQPYTYQWAEDQTDATLVGAAGTETTFDILDSKAPGGRHKQTWRFAGRAECQRCHNKWSGPPLAFNVPQLSKQHYYRPAASQLEVFTTIGLFDKKVPAQTRPVLVDPKNPTAKLEDRARSYLHANCAHCHRQHAGSSVLSKMPFDLPLDKTDMVDVRPTQGAFGILGAHVITSGDPTRSVLWYRMSKLGGGRMPHIGSNEVDREGVELIHQWIEHLSPTETNTGSDHSLAKRHAANLAAIDRLRTSQKPAEQTATIDELLSSTSGALVLLRAIDQRLVPTEVATAAIDKGTQHHEINVRDLFERFLPDEKRIKRLGSVVQPEQILLLAGDPERGKQVFFTASGMSCKNCHQIGKEGKEVGPELTTIAKNNDRIRLLESILQPSKRIDPKFVTYLAETKDGRQMLGVLLKRDANEVVLKDAQDNLIRLATSEIEQLVPQHQSLMPELLVRDMTAQQVADLLSYLESLK